MGIQLNENLVEVARLIATIVAEEWGQFDKVQNEGGRAGCQDDLETFRIMRSSQFMAWPKSVLESYLKDLQDARESGWNLLTEKYARMMESTAPVEYAALKDKLPPRSPERMALQNKIVEIEMKWHEDFAKQYPKYTARGRSIHSNEDNAYNTSSETYLRGELGTYSDNTIKLYSEWIERLLQKGSNLSVMIADNTARQYGYQSIDALESQL